MFPFINMSCLSNILLPRRKFDFLDFHSLSNRSGFVERSVVHNNNNLANIQALGIYTLRNSNKDSVILSFIEICRKQYSKYFTWEYTYLSEIHYLLSKYDIC